MIIVKHRVNNSKDLIKLNKRFGVEIDLRSQKKDIYLHHEPFKKGELFSKWIKNYNHKLIILNVKEEGLEKPILKILRKNKINNFFFHDQTFSSMLKNMSKTKVSIRYSDFEELKKTDILFKKIKWLWVDNFNKLEIDKKLYKLLKRKKVKICLVSPELVKRSRLNEIKKIILFLRKNKIIIDAVCTKRPELWLKF